MSESEFPLELCWDYVEPKVLEKYVHNVGEFERLALRCCVARRKARGRPSFGKDKPLCYVLIYYIREREKANLSELAELLRELGEKYGISVRVSPETLKDRFEEIRKNPRLMSYINEVLKWLEEMKRKGKRILFVNYPAISDVEKLYKAGKVEEAVRALDRVTEWEPLKHRLRWLLRNARLDALRNELSEWIRYAGVVLGLYEKMGIELKKPLPIIKKPIYLSEEELAELCKPESFFRYKDIMLSLGYSQNTIRYIVTPLKEVCGEVMQRELKGWHGKLVQRGVKKSDEHVIYPEEFKMLLQDPRLTWEEKLVLATHITLGCREGEEEVYYAPGKKARGGLLGLRWEWVKWEKRNGKWLPVAIDVLETKTGKGGEEGTWWLGCPLDLFFPWLPEWLAKYWEMKGRPDSGRIFEWSYHRLRRLYEKVREIINEYRKEGKSPVRVQALITPHDARRTHAVWLVMADVPMEVIGGVGLGQQRIPAPLGVSWMDFTTMITYYADLVRKAREWQPRVREWARRFFG